MTTTAGSQDVKKRRIMRVLKINEISAVDRPAQSGARAVIMKRDTSDETSQTEKRGDLISVLTSEVNGHQHGIRFFVEEGELGMYVMYASSDGAENSHDHMVVRDAAGNFVMSSNEGHTHELDQEEVSAALMDFMTKREEAVEKGLRLTGDELAALTKDASNEPAGSAGENVGTGEDDMSDENKTQADLEAMTKRAERAEAIAKMSSDVRSHFDALDAAGQDAFLAKSEADQAADIAKAADANAEVYKANDGSVYTKADDPRLVAMAKSRDADAAKLAKAEEEAADAKLEKRAAELEHIPGDVDTRKAMLKSIDGIEDETQRDAALTALKAQNDALGKAFVETGVSGRTSETGEDNSAEAELDELAKKHAEDNSVSIAKAMTAVLETPKGAELYAQTRNH